MKMNGVWRWGGGWERERREEMKEGMWGGEEEAESDASVGSSFFYMSTTSLVFDGVYILNLTSVSEGHKNIKIVKP